VALGSIFVAMPTRKKPTHRFPQGPCPNCGTELTAQQGYCPTCGQQNHTLRLGFFHFLEELLEGLFHFDGKFFSTFRALFWAMPGSMTTDFLAGKRVRFVSPVRLYVFVSIIFCVLFVESIFSTGVALNPHSKKPPTTTTDTTTASHSPIESFFSPIF
jgi:hypothetical protein